MFFTGKIITSLNFADGTYEKRQLKMFKEIGRLVQYMCPVTKMPNHEGPPSSTIIAYAAHSILLTQLTQSLGPCTNYVDKILKIFDPPSGDKFAT